MNTKFFTNEAENTLLQKIEGIFAHKKIHFFDALIGYFYASGYFQIRKFVENSAQIRVLVGIDVDRLVNYAQAQGLLFSGNKEAAQEDFFEQMKANIQTAQYSKVVEDGMLNLIEDIASKKLIIKIHPNKNIHAKVYIFREATKHAHGYGSVITGSSNLTASGLARNFEFNVELRDNADIEFANETFEKLWAEGEPLAEDFVLQIKKETYLNDELTPYELYMKFLMVYFDKRIEFDASSASDMPTGFKRLSYQIDAVNDGYAKMIKHNGFFLADVVGLGKTIIATLIAKKYYFSNGHPKYQTATLIVVPPALKENWQETTEKFRLANVEIITNGSLHQIKNPKKYDLIIVDEAHKFRSDSAEMYNNLQKICKSPTAHIDEDGNAVPKRVILISATPLNNKPEDIANLVYLFEDSKNSKLEIDRGNLQHFFRQHIDSYHKVKNEEDVLVIREKVKQIYEQIRNKVISPLTVRRTRTDLNEHAQYKNDLVAQGIKFPNVGKPEKIFYALDAQLETLYDKTIRLLSHIVDGLSYNRYKAISYLKSDKKNKYKKADVISNQLAFIMKTMLVKRIDSSFHAFKMSIFRFREATMAMVKMMNQGQVFIAPKLNVSEYINDGKEADLMDIFEKQMPQDDLIEIFYPDDFELEFGIGLEKDLAILNELVADWAKVETDPKLDKFVDYLANCLFDSRINRQQKLVVFSESKETTAYLAEKLSGEYRVIAVDSGNRKDKMPIIRANFDANLEANLQKNEYDILISTEVLAEGVNLHRANVIVNYDTPWNSTRLMQRIGRVNRIGSTADNIHIFNFFPTAQVNNDIELEKRAIMKLQAFHAALGEDSQVYSPDEETQSFGIFDKDIDDGRDEELSYLMEVRAFKANHPILYKSIKKMPLRARVGRKNKVQKGSSMVFIRNSQRDAFLYIQPNNRIEELSFIEAVHIFKARETEKSIDLHSQHHEQISKGLLHFNEKIESEKASQLKTTALKQSPNELKALIFLQKFLSISAISEDEKAMIEAAREAIQLGKFQQLQRQINKLETEQNKLIKDEKQYTSLVLLDKLIGIINQYPIEYSSEDDDTKGSGYIESVKTPEIIISESFDS